MFARLLHRVMAAVVVLLVTAAGARLAAELMAPLVPWLVLAGGLGVVYALIFGRLRR